AGLHQADRFLLKFLRKPSLLFHRVPHCSRGTLHFSEARPDTLVVLDQAEPHLGGSEKMATAFFKMSRSIRSRSFSRRSREISAAGSGTKCGADAGIGRSADPASRPPLPLRQLRSIEGEMPSSLAI